MKKTILSVAILAASMIGFSSFAQTPETVVVGEVVEATVSDAAPQARPDKSGKKMNKQGKKGQKGQKPGNGKRCNIFEGLNLTSDQQSALEALIPCKGDNNGQCQSGDQQQCQRPDNAQCQKPSNCKANKDRKPNAPQAGQRQQPSEDQIAAMKAKKAEFLGKVKGILTPEQYIQFLENNFRMPGARK